jgi:hypothetical protein
MLSRNAAKHLLHMNERLSPVLHPQCRTSVAMLRGI